MEIVSVIGFSLVAAMLVILLRQIKPEFALPVGVLAAAIILFSAASASLPIIDKVKEISAKASINSEYVSILIKSLGICYITQLASDTCKDGGENALAGNVQLIGKIAVVVLSLPLVTQVLDTVTKLIG